LHSPEARTAPQNFRTSENELVQAILAKDRKATAEFVELHADAVYSFVSRRVFPREDLADDLVQETFLAALEGLHRFKGTSNLRSWLLAIARHRVQDYYRDRVREISLDETEIEPGVDEPFDDWIDDRNLEQRVQRTLAEVPEGYRLMLLWRYWEKCSAAEMAQRVGKTEKAIERLLMRAREQFRRRWYSE
jgi:RNA polymerase sigma-70 factor (ECF subfamily)